MLLRLPRLTGASIPNLTVLAADAGNIAFGRESGATDPGQSSSDSSDIVFTSPDGHKTTFHSSTAHHVDYLGSAVPASIGYITLLSPMGLLPGESQGPAPEVGQPHWSCRAAPGQRQDQLFPSGVDSDGGFKYFTPPALKAFGTTSLPDCAGIIALAEAGSQSRRDLWLLIIGAALSTVAALLISAVAPDRGHDRSGEPHAPAPVPDRGHDVSGTDKGQPIAPASVRKRGSGKPRRSSR